MPTALHAQPGGAPPATGEAALAANYYAYGEYEKALTLYQKLARNEPSDDYLFRVAECYANLNRYDEAQEYLRAQSKRYPDRPQLVGLSITLYTRAKQADKAQALFDELLTKRLKTLTEFTLAGSYFTRARDYTRALKVYQKGREMVRSTEVFAAALADLYRETGQYGLAVDEYLKLMRQVPEQQATLRTDILNMVSPESYGAIETALLTNLNKQPDPLLRELLYDFYLQAENYEEAFIQAKSLDKLQRENGIRLFRLGQTLQQSERYELSTRVFEHIIDNVKGSPQLIPAYYERVKNYELQSFARKPLDTVGIRQAVRGYDALFGQFGRNVALSEAMMRKARLCLFQLNDLPCAEAELNNLQALRLNANQQAEVRLLQGDLLLIRGEYYKARIKFQEVEDQFREGQLGALAKFRSAQLDYYKGEFQGAKARLDILKDNSSNDIANDAIQLLLLLTHALGVDSAPEPLQLFAEAQLKMYQKQYRLAEPILDTMLFRYPNHPLVDEAYWEKARIAVEERRTDAALAYIERILTAYGDGTLGDDALFLRAELQQFAQNDKAAAQKTYLELLTTYPGSLLGVEARRRIRKLRGELTQ
jgi:tetratricopeptide (TPR) repeat protein